MWIIRLITRRIIVGETTIEMADHIGRAQLAITSLKNWSATNRYGYGNVPHKYRAIFKGSRRQTVVCMNFRKASLAGNKRRTRIQGPGSSGRAISRNIYRRIQCRAAGLIIVHSARQTAVIVIYLADNADDHINVVNANIWPGYRCTFASTLNRARIGPNNMNTGLMIFFNAARQCDYELIPNSLLNIHLIAVSVLY